MNILPVSFGMSAIFTQKGKEQFVKASARASEAKADSFIKASEDFKTKLEESQHVDVIIDKKGIFFPRLKAKVVRKDTRKPLSKTHQPVWDRTSIKIFDESIKMAELADKAFETSTQL